MRVIQGHGRDLSLEAGRDFSFPVVFFDGDCVFCRGSVRFLRRMDRRRLLHYASLQGETAGALPDSAREADAIVLVEGRSVYCAYPALLRIAELLYPSRGAIFSVLRVPGFLFFGQLVYYIVSRLRRRFNTRICSPLRVTNPDLFLK